MSKYEVGESVKFIYAFDRIINGVILQVRKVPFVGTRYLVAYGIGNFGVKHSDAAMWVSESKVFNLGALKPTKADV